MQKKYQTSDLTVGKPIVKIFWFALPLVFGTLFQQLYSFVDTVIVGRCISANALAAVGTTYSLHFLILGFVQGFCVGLGVPVSQSFGAKEPENMHRYLWNGIWLCVAVSLVLSVAMTALTEPLLTLMHTPGELFEMAAQYIRILFIGIPASTLYNFSASVLRAVGDSKRPFYFLVFSSFLNIALDYILIVPFGMGVAGAAIATVFSQLVSGVLNTWWLFAKTSVIRIRKEETSFSVSHAKRLCVIGLPMGFEYSVSAIGAVIMQNSINLLGTVAVTAQTAGEKIRQMFTLPMESVGMAMTTYTGQNYGADRMDRVKSGIKSGLTIQAIYCVAAWIVIFFGKYALVALVLGESSSAEAQGAVQYLSIISTLFILHGSLMIFRNVLQGLGYSFQAILSGVGELLGRSLGAWLAVCFTSYTAICYSNPIAWGFALCYCVFMVWRKLRNNDKAS